MQRSVLVRVTTDEGVEGWGNVDPTPGYSLVSAIDIHDAAKAAIEIALLEVKGRALGVPVHSLLGGALTHDVTLNAWIGTVAPEQAAREAAEWLRRGFTTAKIKVSGYTTKQSGTGLGLSESQDHRRARGHCRGEFVPRARDDVHGLAADPFHEQWGPLQKLLRRPELRGR